MKLGSLQLRVLVYVAGHSGASLTAPQIAEMFAFEHRENVTTALRRAVTAGWLRRDDSSKPCQYSAGPQLLKTVGIAP